MPSLPSNTDNDKLLKKFRNRALCKYLMKHTHLKSAKNLADLFAPVELGDEKTWQRHARGEENFSPTKITLIENAYELPFDWIQNRVNLGSNRKEDYRTLYKRVSNIRSIYEVGPESSSNCYVPLWRSLSESIGDYNDLMDDLRGSFSWPEEAVDFHKRSGQVAEAFTLENPDIPNENLPRDAYPLSIEAACYKLSLESSLVMPEFTNWHKLTLLIILFRFGVEYERSELNNVAINLGWNHTDGINDEILEPTFVSEEASQKELEDMYNHIMPIHLHPLNIGYLKKEIQNQLLAMKDDLSEYGLSPEEMDFYFRQLYANFFTPKSTLKQLNKLLHRRNKATGTILGH